MYKLFVIAKNNMKKQKSDMFTFLILTFIASFLLFDCASAILGISRVLDDRFEAINGAHVMLICGNSEEETEAAEKAFEENDDIISYEQTPCLNINSKYRKKGEKEYMEYQFLAESFDVQKNIMKVNEPGGKYKKDDILLPFNMHNSFAEGDVIQLKLGDDTYDFTVAGYLEDPYFCSTLNLTIYSVCISQEMMDELSHDHSNLAKSFIAHKGRVDSTKLESGELATSDIESKIGTVFKDGISEAAELHPEKSYNNYMLANWQMMRGGSQFIPIIVIAIILIFSVLILVIAIVVISFSVKNFIQKNMKNTGILEASGYTVSELRWALTLQIALVGIIGSILGIVVAILTFNSFGDIIASILGLRWNQPINCGVAVASLVLVVAVLSLVARVISRAYKKITVLDALRGGISNHNFKKNFFSFEKTPLPIPLTMSLKDTFGGLGKNILMVFIAAILAISTLTGFGLLENYGKDPSGMLNMFGFEMGTVMIADSNGNQDYEKLSDELSKLDGVSNVLTSAGFEPDVKYAGKEQAVFTYAVDDVENTQNTVLLEGRYPEKDNEILVTPGVVKDLNVKIGDVVTIEYADKEAEFIIVGTNQRMERMGRTIIMTIDGAKRIVPGGMMYQYYVTADDGVSYDDITKELKTLEKDEDYSFNTLDLNKQMQSTVESLAVSMKLICIIISVITMIVVIFVESLVIRAKISREWRGMGISKALGQTSGNLISQIMFSNMPAIIVGTLVGSLLAPSVGSSTCKAAFSLFVIKDVPFSIPPYYMIFTVVGIVVIALLTSASSGLKVRGLNPVEMITEE